MELRKLNSLDNGWRFELGDKNKISLDLHHGWFAKAGGALGAPSLDFDDSSWSCVDLPHDWAIELDYDQKGEESLDYVFHGFKPVGLTHPETSVGWYRLRFDVPKEDMGKRLSVKFDGIYRDSIVWLNGHYLGRHTSGYTSFSYDVTDVVNYDDTNVLVVRADATHYEGWWYEGAGIYHHVWLLKNSPLHVEDSGTFITSQVNESSVDVAIQTKVVNDADDIAPCTITSTIVDPDGKDISSEETQTIEIQPWTQTEFSQNIKIETPKLWSPETPFLYKLKTTVKKESTPTDQYETSFGIRSFHFDPDKGFFLNGKHTVLKGVCGHPDHAGVGAAVPDRLHQWRLERLKEMGVNAVRSPHCCPSKEWLQTCDRIGLLVVGENRFLGNSKESLSQLESMIIRDRNHPSIIMWSLGNEEFIQSSEVGARIAKTMQRLVKSLDPTRPTTFGANNDGTDTGINSVVDVRGWNYMYNGGVDEYHKRNPDQPIVILEEASTLCTRGEYADDSEKCYVSAYDEHPPDRGTNVWMGAEEWWTYCQVRPYLAGGFVWTGFDYGGEPTPYWRWPCVSSNFGVMDICGFPKDNYYYYQSWWSDKTVLHIFPHWNWKGKEGQLIDVRCFSNCDSVELFVNGKSLGKKQMPRNSHLKWAIEYQLGAIEAKGYKDGKVVTEKKIETTGGPSGIRMIPDRTEIKADSKDISVVNIEMIDSEGRVVPTASNEIYFEIKGNGQIIGAGNGNPINHEPAKFNRRKAFNGLCQVIVQSTEKAGVIELKAASEGLQKSCIKVISL